MRKKDIDEKLEEIIAIAAGEVSMCWSTIPTGVFNSEKSVKIVAETVKQIKKAVLEEELKELQKRFKERE